MPHHLAGPCSVAGCPGLATHGGRCAAHKQTTSQRDYGQDHQVERQAWQQLIDSGSPVLCRRCKQPIPPHDPAAWDLGHPAPKHPECRSHNRATAGRDRS
jgi:hypothetical protein